ncbi:hypothetical protein M514_13214 [Trichuris suis]|uniref:Uncharacterized protein n=1 Tax=Trichuris suis TaxID=68888 RepID=A0A085N381_9BILA|nr:hypothetical protein M513_13214 [Trichuris suis]KFD63927.1 hypothetical protein M514_13214 [Trichuris suis]
MSLAEASAFQCLLKPTIKANNSTYKPDLVLIRNKNAWNIDIAICDPLGEQRSPRQTAQGKMPQIDVH